MCKSRPGSLVGRGSPCPPQLSRITCEGIETWLAPHAPPLSHELGWGQIGGLAGYWVSPVRGQTELPIWSGAVARGGKLVASSCMSCKGEAGVEALLTPPSPVPYPVPVSGKRELVSRTCCFARKDLCCPKNAMEEGAQEL